MKPLDKLEQQFLNAIKVNTSLSVTPYDIAMAKRCAKVAVDLAKRAHNAGFDSGMKYGSYSMSELPDDIDSGLKNPEYTDFLKSEGIDGE